MKFRHVIAIGIVLWALPVTTALLVLGFVREGPVIAGGELLTLLVATGCLAALGAFIFENAICAFSGAARGAAALTHRGGPAAGERRAKHAS